MDLSKISIWRGEMDMQKSIKSLKRNGILLLAYDLLVLCIVFVKNGMINMSAEAATSLIVSIGFGIFINLLWIMDSKTWITDYGKRCILRERSSMPLFSFSCFRKVAICSVL